MEKKGESGKARGSETQLKQGAGERNGRRVSETRLKQRARERKVSGTQQRARESESDLDSKTRESGGGVHSGGGGGGGGGGEGGVVHSESGVDIETRPKWTPSFVDECIKQQSKRWKSEEEELKKFIEKENEREMRNKKRRLKQWIDHQKPA